MSMDFDSAALQTQHDEEEYDQEDYAREQELHKLLTDLPHDMLDDSRDSLPSDLEDSVCSNKNSGSSPRVKWTQQWSDNPGPACHAQNYDKDSRGGQAREDGVHNKGHPSQPQSHPPPHTWTLDHHMAQGDYPCKGIGTEKSTETCQFPPEFQSAQAAKTNVEYNEEGGYVDKKSHFQVTYSPQHAAHQPKMINPQGAQQEAHFDHLQREFLDTTQQNSQRQQLAQLQILNKAQQRQIEDLEQKLEDSRRNMRYIEHQFAIVRDEKDGLSVSLKESSRIVEEAKVREVQVVNKLKALEQQVQILNDKNQENIKKQMVADAEVDSMKQQMLDLCRSDTLSRVRQQHDRDLTIMKEQHNSAMLALQEKLDSTCHSLQEQVNVCQSLRDHVNHLECQKEQHKLERAKVVNALTQRLEESQQQCAKLLETSSIQEMSQMQIKLQQAQSAKALSENMNKVLQEDMADLKEQITLYESAVKHGVIALDPSSEWENQLSDSCLDLGLKKTNRKNGMLQSNTFPHLSDSKLPKDETLKLLQMEMQRCLGCLKGERQKVNELQQELKHCTAQFNEVQKELEEAKVKASARESSRMKLTGDSQKEVVRLQEDKKLLQEQLELLDKKNKELKLSEEQLKSANSELCTKMREMIQELDREKQEATLRSERIHQQFRDDVVNQVRTELTLEHKAHIEELSVRHQQESDKLQTQLSEVYDKMLGVQECYLAICNEKNMLEETIRKHEQEEASIRQQGVTAVEKLRTELEAQHQASLLQLKDLWSKTKETEIQQQVSSRVSAARALWKEELQKTERAFTQKLEDDKRRTSRAEATCQTNTTEDLTVTVEELESRLSAQRQELQLHADKVQREAVEEARQQAQREAQDKYLEDMAKQVEAAVARAYNHWIEDLTSLPEYKASLLTEQKKWQELQGKHTEQQVSQALKDAEEKYHRMEKKLLDEQGCERQRLEELQKELAALQIQLQQVTREHAVVMKAELAGAREAWMREKHREIALIQAHTEQVHQTKVQEQLNKLEEVRKDAELQKKKLVHQMEAKLQQTMKTREEEWQYQFTIKELTQKRQLRDEFKAQLEAGLAEVQAKLLNHQDGGDSSEIRGAASEATIKHVIHQSCRDLINRAIAQAKKEWEKMSEERLQRALTEAKEQHERDVNKIQRSLSERKESGCKKECVQNTSKLQKKNNELQRHLEKACRQLQHSICEHKTAIQQLKDEHQSSLQKVMEEHLQQLEEVQRSKESAGNSEQRKLQQGLQEMKEQYLMTVEKIRGDMFCYLQESRDRAAEMIHREVQRERQDTARKMRHYYLTCLQELLEDGGTNTGAEKKIMNAASKLVAMAKVFETPIKGKLGKHYDFGGCSTASSTTTCPPGGEGGVGRDAASRHTLPDIKEEERSHRQMTRVESEQKPAATVRTKISNHLYKPSSKKNEGSVNSHGQTKTLLSHKPRQTVAFQCPGDFENMSIPGTNGEPYLQVGGSTNADDCLLSEGQSSEARVRQDQATDWRAMCSDSQASFHASTPSFLGSKLEPVKAFAAPAALDVIGERSTDHSDLTICNDTTKVPLHTKAPPLINRFAQRGPTPGSEFETQQVCSRPLFFDLRRHQQDSGFGSPFLQHN